VPGGTNDVPINNRSFLSFDGVNFELDSFFNYRFSLRLGERQGCDELGDGSDQGRR
jgi:hypothetical protein